MHIPNPVYLNRIIQAVCNNGHNTAYADAVADANISTGSI